MQTLDTHSCPEDSSALETRLAELFTTTRSGSHSSAPLPYHRKTSSTSTLSLGGQKAVNYGEILLSSWATVLRAVRPGASDIFFDLGSGRGALVLLTHLLCGTKRSVGVELSRERHAMAVSALSALRSSKKCAGGIQFLNEDARRTDLSAATFIFLMNQDMPHRLIADVWRNILAVPHAVTVATLHPPRDVNVGVPPEQTLTLPQAWNAAIDVHVYRLPGLRKMATSPQNRRCAWPAAMPAQCAAHERVPPSGCVKVSCIWCGC